MDRISELNASQVAKELQGYKRYSRKTQKEIKDKVGGVDSLRDELRRLEKKTRKIKENIIYLEGIAYTEEELIKMVKYHKENYTKPSPHLNNDMYKEIMLNASPNTIKNLCLTNKTTNDICNSIEFWYDKFTFDNLPHPVLIKKHQGHKLVIPPKMKKLPKTTDEWINAYKKMLESYRLAVKLENNIVDTNQFKDFTVNVRSQDMLWLPQNMVDKIKEVDSHEINIYFSIKDNNYFLELIIQQEEDEELDYIRIQLTRKEFINYLTLLFYYHIDEEDFLLNNEPDEEDEDVFMKNDLMNNKKMKKYFPKW